MRKQWPEWMKWAKLAGEILLIAAVVWLVVYFLKGLGIADGCVSESWVLCRPGSQVNVRRTPDKRGEPVGYLEAGDWFRTNGESKNGYIRCYDIGEYGEGWIYCGYVVTEEPEEVFQKYMCVANKRVACRKWIGGPQNDKFAWLANGNDVDVFYIADGWACTSRGYIVAEWLEVDLR